MRLPCSPLENCIRNSVKIANLSTTPRIIISVFPGFSHRSAYAPKHSKCPQGISKCLFSWAFLYPDVVLSHIRTEGQTAGQQANFSFFQICQKQQFNMSQKCIRSWKMYLQSLTIIDFPTLCANQMCAKKWVEESFIINLWKQRLVLAFFLPSSSLLGCDLLVLANICLALRNVTILWQGKVAYNRHHVCFETYKDEMPFLHYCNEWPTSWGKFAFEKWFSFK